MDALMDGWMDWRMDSQPPGSYMRLSELAAMVVRCFSRALSIGVQHIFQTLPRLLTIWLDFTMPLPEDKEPEKTG